MENAKNHEEKMMKRITLILLVMGLCARTMHGMEERPQPDVPCKLLRAITAMNDVKIPKYSAETMGAAIRNLNKAHDDKNDVWIEQRAKIVAGLCISDGSLQQLYETAHQYPLLDPALSQAVKDSIYRYIPQMWAERFRLAAPHVVAFSPDQSKVVTVSSKGMRMRDVTSCGELYSHDDDQACSAAFSPDNKWLAVAYNCGITKIIDVEKLQTTHAIQVEYDPLYRACKVNFSHDNNYIVFKAYAPGHEKCDQIVKIVRVSSEAVMSETEWEKIEPESVKEYKIIEPQSSDDSDITKIVSSNTKKNLLVVKTGIVSSEIRDKVINLICVEPDNSVHIKTGRVLASNMYYLKGASVDKSMLVVSNMQTGMLVEQAAHTFDQALFLHLLQWCRKNGHPIKEHAWAQKAFDTYADKTVIEKLMSASDIWSGDCTIV